MPLSAATNRPRWSAMAPVNEPLVWPKSSLSSSVSGIAPQLIATNASAARAREKLLARAAIALDQHARVARGHALRLREEVLHERGAGDDVLAPRLADARGDAGAAVQRERALDLREEVVRVVGLGEIAEHAALHRGHGVGNRAVRGENDHRKAGVRRLDLVEEGHAVHALHAQVGEHEVRARGGDGGERALAAFHGRNAVSVGLEPDGEEPEDVRIVIDEEQRGLGVLAHQGRGGVPATGGSRRAA